ncbi:MAG: hypothetical protein R3C10_07680 [Pirellulales bacterium]
MSLHVELTLRAERDVDEILGFLSKRSPQGAATWLACLEEVLADQSGNALRMPLDPENRDHDEEIRHVIFKTRRRRKHRANYVVRGQLVLVTNVRGPGQDRISPRRPCGQIVVKRCRNVFSVNDLHSFCIGRRVPYGWIPILPTIS